MRISFDFQLHDNLAVFTFMNADSDEVFKSFIVHTSQDETNRIVMFVNDKKNHIIGYNQELGFNCLNFLICGLDRMSASEKCKVFNVLRNDMRNFDLEQKTYSYDEIKDARDGVQYNQADVGEYLRDKGKIPDLAVAALVTNARYIPEIPVSEDKYFSEIDFTPIQKVIEYSQRNAAIVMRVINAYEEDLHYRWVLGKTFKQNLMSLSSSKVSERVISAVYSARTGIRTELFKDQRGEPVSKFIYELLPSEYKYNSQVLKELYDKMRLKRIGMGEDVKTDFIFGNNSYRITSNSISTTTKHKIHNAHFGQPMNYIDFSSYFAGVMIHKRLSPPHLQRELLDVFKELYDMRMNSDTSGMVNGLKSVLNNAIGRLNFEHSWMYSPETFYAVAFNAQFMMLNLIEKIYDSGCEILFCKNDGLLFKGPSASMASALCEVASVEQETGINIKRQAVTKAVIKDQNNVLFIRDEEIVHSNGVFSLSKGTTPTMVPTIVPLAIRQYFLLGVDPSKTVELVMEMPENEDFLMSQNIGDEFKFQITKQKLSGVDVEDINSRIVRFVVSKSNQRLFKRKSGAIKPIPIVKDKAMTIGNDKTNVDGVKIDHSYYSSEARKVIDQFNENQTSLF